MNSDPVLKRGPAGSWDEYGVWTGTVLFNDNGDSLRMWYSGGNNNATYPRIGYATAFFDPPDNITGLADTFFGELPREYELKQNYPNPFNPSTMINYQLQIKNDVELSVYDLLGKKVATLVNQRQQAGYYQVEWDATGFASGVYYYRLEAGNFMQIRKMIYLK